MLSVQARRDCESAAVLLLVAALRAAAMDHDEKNHVEHGLNE